MSITREYDEARAASLQRAVAAAVQALDARFVQLQADTERDLLGPLEVRHARELLDLRQRQLFELSSTMEALAPEDVLRKAQAAEAMHEAQELAQFQVCCRSGGGS